MAESRKATKKTDKIPQACPTAIRDDVAEQKISATTEARIIQSLENSTVRQCAEVFCKDHCTGVTPHSCPRYRAFRCTRGSFIQTSLQSGYLGKKHQGHSRKKRDAGGTERERKREITAHGSPGLSKCRS